MFRRYCKIRKTIIRTIDESYEVCKGISFFENQIGDKFLKVNRGCIVNFSNVKEVDYESFSIIFHNKIVLRGIISTSHLKNVRKMMQINV